MIINDWLRLALVVVLGVAVVVLFARYTVWAAEKFDNAAAGPLPSAKMTVSYYYMDSCPHCEAFKSEWAKFKAAAAGMGVATEETSVNADPDKVKAAGVQAFPTILVKRDEQSVEYTGDRKSDALVAFLKAATAAVGAAPEAKPDAAPPAPSSPVAPKA